MSLNPFSGLIFYLYVCMWLWIPLSFHFQCAIYICYVYELSACNYMMPLNCLIRLENLFLIHRKFTIFFFSADMVAVAAFHGIISVF
jgi:hypothetical protein